MASSSAVPRASRSAAVTVSTLSCLVPFTATMRLAPWLVACLVFSVVSMEAAQADLNRDSFLVRNTADLVGLCSARQSDPIHVAATNFCSGFTVAAFRLLWAEDMARRSNHLLCVPSPQPTRDEVITGFLNWASATPSQMSRPAIDGFRAFIEDQYGCNPQR
jgi:hypothetical protein